MQLKGLLDTRYGTNPIEGSKSEDNGQATTVAIMRQERL
jgi:hypothetical protein